MFFTSTLKAERTKFDARAEACVFVGYPPNQKAYNVLNLSTHKMQISRDIVFHEQQFPFHIKSPPLQNSSPIQLFTPTSNTYHIFIDPFDIVPELEHNTTLPSLPHHHPLHNILLPPLNPLQHNHSHHSHHLLLLYLNHPLLFQLDSLPYPIIHLLG